MDAHALLTSHGWRGTGHSLHATDDKIGLAKPLLLNRRDGNKGLGQKAHFTSDLWWMNAFDEQLQGLQHTKSKDGQVGVVQTVKDGRINSVEKGMGGRWKLGGNFVRGGFLQGTLEMLKTLETTDSSEEDSSSGEKSTEVSTGVSTPLDAQPKTETKEERRKRKAEKAARWAERDARRKRKELEKAKKKAAKKERDASADTPSDSTKEEKAKGSKREETKEERRARREAKRLRREAREAKRSK